MMSKYRIDEMWVLREEYKKAKKKNDALKSNLVLAESEADNLYKENQYLIRQNSDLKNRIEEFKKTSSELLNSMETIRNMEYIYPEYLESKAKAKATPMKIYRDKDEEPFCPRCKSNQRILTFESDTIFEEENNYCGCCGQAIDWSEDE